MVSKNKWPMWTYFGDNKNDPGTVMYKVCETNISRRGVGKTATISEMIISLENKLSDEYRRFSLRFLRSKKLRIKIGVQIDLRQQKAIKF